jgi:hypothetical protein
VSGSAVRLASAIFPEKVDDWLGDDPANIDNLHPILQLYMTSSSLGPFLNSPWVQQLPFYSWKLANESYEHKSAYIAELIGKGEYGHALVIYERPYRIPTFIDWVKANRISDDEGRDIWDWLWRDCEHPKQFGYGTLVKMFKRYGFLTDDDEDAKHPICRPTEPLTIYRGVHRASDARGLSWTLDLSRARWFAMRFSRNLRGLTYKAVIPPEGVLARFDGRNESEVVVDPKLLQNVELLPQEDK